MKTSFKIKMTAIVICGLVLFPLYGSARSEESKQTVQPGASVFSRVDAYIAREMKRQRLPGLALGIVQGDRILYLKGYGAADSSGRPVTPDTPFGLGSISKSITATAVLQLAEAGKIDLDALAQRYISPAYNGAASVTVRQLLNQTSGLTQLSTFRNTLSSIHDHDDALKKNAMSYADKFLKPSGRTEHPFAYSNANYILLGYIVQQVSGQSYGGYVKEHIFGPLSMRDSFVTLDEAAAHGLAAPYRRMFGANLAYDGPFVYIPGDVPAGYLYTSAKDMSHYLIAQMNGGRFAAASVLSPESVRLMQTEPVPGTYAMGWMSGRIGSLPVIGHPGGSIGFQAQTWIVPEQKLGVIVFANVLDIIDAAIPKTHIITTTHIASGVVRLMNGQPIEGAGPSITQKYGIADGIMILLGAWLLLATARTAKRSFGPPAPGRSGRAGITIKAISKIVLHFAGLIVVLLLSLTQVVPYWHIATVYQPDMILWLKAMTALMALKGSLEWIRIARSIRHQDHPR